MSTLNTTKRVACLPTAPSSASASDLGPWPYPRWIAHRGAGTLAPENTLNAFELGASLGHQMFELDVRQSADGVVFLLHDATLERTSNGHGLAQEWSWPELAQLDAGAWHSDGAKGARLLKLSDLLDAAHSRGWCLNIEIKSQGEPKHDETMGQSVAATLQAHVDGGRHLVTSFSPSALQGFRRQAPELSLGYLMDTWCEASLEQVKALNCCAVVLAHGLWTAHRLQSVRSVACWAVAYTVNETQDAERLWSMGLNALITDRIDVFRPQP